MFVEGPRRALQGEFWNGGHVIKVHQQYEECYKKFALDLTFKKRLLYLKWFISLTTAYDLH